MIAAGSLEYAQARIGARNGRRPREADWQRIEVVREFGAALDAANGTRLRHLVAGIVASQGVHDVEARLRARWRSLVTEVASWMPAQWQPALRWCETLIDLPVLQYLADGGLPLPWMRDAPLYREVCIDDPQRRGQPLRKGTFAPLASAWAAREPLLSGWRAEWMRRLPAPLADSALLARLVTLVEQHLAAFSTLASGDAWPLRRALQARIATLFRRATLDPAAAFAFLALAALDIERLRGELVRRVAFPSSSLAG